MKKILFSIFILISHLANSQSRKIEGPYLQSPNAASLGIYNKIDISPFTGLPNVNIPVFSVAHGDISISADLRYFGGGVKPEDHPGWVGQNWSLNVGGIVTRKRNGGVDEIYTNNHPNNFSYYINYGVLNTSTWNSQSFMTNYLNNDVSNGRFTQLSPDEFMFNLPNGKSGSFMKNDLGNWVVKSSNGGRMQVAVSLSPSSPNLLELHSTVSTNEVQAINRIIYQIIIADDEGYIFTFGGSLDAVEFIRESNPDMFESKNSVIANAWHLMKIESPKGNIVNFKYDRGSHQFIQDVGYSHTLSYQIDGNTCSGYNINSLRYSGYIITPSFLKEINSESFKIVFNREESNELKYPYSAFNLTTFGHAFNDFGYGDFSNGHYPDVQTDGGHLLQGNPHKDYKLKEIIISNQNGEPKERYSFDYNNDLQNLPNQRLFLKSFNKQHPLMLIDENELSQPITYSFEYDDAEALPPYNSLKIDEWGYYNNKPYPITSVNVDVNLLKSKYLPDFNYAKKGSLIQIKYPTGGYTNFEYELNEYSQYVKKTPNAVSLVPSIGSGGGLRIRKIDNYSKTAVYTSKQYVYKNSSNISSGILAGRKDIYYRAQIGTPATVVGYAEYVSNNSISDLNYTNGRDVVYSEVKEILEDGSSNIYKYSNSDNIEYRDENPGYIYAQGIAVSQGQEYGSFSSTFDPSYTFPLISHTSREQERGQLLSKETYSANGNIVYKQINQYRNDATRFQEYVKSFNYASQTLSCAAGFITERYVEPVKIYTYFPYLKSQTEYSYDVDENLISAVTNDYNYDHLNRVVKDESFTNSKGEIVKTEFKYPFDFLPGSLFQDMINKNLGSKLIQKTQTINNLPISTEKINYALQNGLMYLPASTEFQAGTGTSQVTFYEYNSDGNLRSIANDGGAKTSYIWGYKKQHPVAETKSANYTEVYHQNFEGTLDFSGGVMLDNFHVHTGKTSVKINNTGIVEKVSPSTSRTPVNLTKKKRFMYSGWVFSDSPSAQIFLMMLRPGETGAYSYADQVETSETGRWVYLQKEVELPADVANVYLRLDNNNTGNVWFDDLRIHPAESSMNTYTYDHLTGMTSQTDAKGMTTYYEYDDFNRLRNIKNQKGEIIKDYTYNFHQVYANSYQSATFNKNCTTGIGSNVTYSVAAGKYTSTESLEAANNLALADIAANGQNYANTHGTCGSIYVKKRISATGQDVIAGNLHTYVEYSADFYSDEACTQSYVLTSPLVIKFSENGVTTYSNGNPSVPFNHTYQQTALAGVSTVRLMAAWSYCIGGPPIIEPLSKNADTSSTKVTPAFVARGVPPPPDDPDNPNYCYSSTVSLVNNTGYVIKLY